MIVTTCSNINNNYQSTQTNENISNEDSKINWGDYFQNYRAEDFNEKFDVEDNDPRTFAEKYGLTITRLPPITYEALIAGNDLFSPFTITENNGYNKYENSISLVPGTEIDLKNGMVLKIKDNFVDIYCKDDSLYSTEKYKHAGSLSAALNKFIRYANGQNGSLGFDDEMRKLVTSVLEKMGIDTTKVFKVNGTSFSTTENNRGTLEKVGSNPYYSMIPEYMMKQVLESYDSNAKWA